MKRLSFDGEMTRRRILGAASLCIVAPNIARAEDSMSNSAPNSMPNSMPTNDAESMQATQRGGLYANLHDPKITELPADAFAQRFIYSPAPKAEPQGQWTKAPPLPIPRSEMAWATAEGDRMHVIGGYAEQQVSRAYHHVYSATDKVWRQAAPIPRGANHIGVAALDGVVYACGGFVEQNRVPLPDCYAYDVADDRWRPIRPLQRGSRGAISVVALAGLIHAIGGRDTRSIDWHEAYDPKADAWRSLAPIPGPRDHAAAAAIEGLIYVVGGRMDTFDFNTGMHVVYDPQRDAWEERAPLPTPRSGHGGVLYRDQLFVMGGEGTRRVFGQNEAYDPKADSWRSFAAMPTPRHGMGAAVLGDAIHVAGGGPMNGGSFQSAAHEAFAL
jgi:N-acetylneuraminic acid mutarotase